MVDKTLVKKAELTKNELLMRRWAKEQFESRELI